MTLKSLSSFGKMTSIVLLSTVFAIAPMQTAIAENHKQGVNTISVSATGTAAKAPDMATLRLAVLREGETARQALSANNDAMAKVLEALSGAGVPPEDLQTSGISIQPIYSQSVKTLTGYEQPKIESYRVSNTITVRVRDLAKLGTILDTSVTLGVNSGGSVRFGHQDRSPRKGREKRN